MIVYMHGSKTIKIKYQILMYIMQNWARGSITVILKTYFLKISFFFRVTRGGSEQVDSSDNPVYFYSGDIRFETEVICYHDRGFCNFYQLLQANIWTVPLLKSRPIPPTAFQIPYYPNFLDNRTRC